MTLKQLQQQIINDIKTTKSTDYINEFKANIQNFNRQELNQILNEINENIYFGQHGVDDISWFNLKTLIKYTLELQL